jgi:hypothetical protein
MLIVQVAVDSEMNPTAAFCEVTARPPRPFWPVERHPNFFIHSPVPMQCLYQSAGTVRVDWCGLNSLHVGSCRSSLHE